MKIAAVIPARYDSTRFPGKVLAKDTGKFLIQHTYEQACKAKLPQKVILATDSDKVMDAAKLFGAECVMTSSEHKSGTDRIAEATAKMDVDIVINVQGDEPEIDPGHIDYVAQLLIDNPATNMATLGTSLQDIKQVTNPNIVKVITDVNKKALYFSRSVIPYDRQAGGIGPLSLYLWHMGIYAYRKNFLKIITSLPQTTLEKTESLEQLRVLENGFSILVGKVEHRSEGIDTPEQYAKFVSRYLAKNKKM